MIADKQEAKEHIRGLIRQGYKTSEIVALSNHPLDLIKDVKSEELENDKKIERESKRQDQIKHMVGKREKHHKAFLKRIGQDPDKVKAAPAFEPPPASVITAPVEEVQATEEGKIADQSTYIGATGEAV